MDAKTVYRDIAFLNPKFMREVERLDQSLTRLYQAGVLETRFKIFESFRSPARQLFLLKQGTTKAGPWQSAHQFGLAVDFVPYLDPAQRRSDEVMMFAAFHKKATINPGEGGWYWPPASHEIWQVLKKQCAVVGVDNSITWDRPHVQSPLFEKMVWWR